MPIRKLNSTDDHDWINSSLQGKTNDLDPDVWADATRVASKLLFTEKLTRIKASHSIANQFKTSLQEAQAVINAVIKNEAEQITLFEPTIRAKAIHSETNMQVIRAQLVNEVQCETQSGKTITAARNAQGESYSILSEYEADEAVAALSDIFDEELGDEYEIIVFIPDDGYEGLGEWLSGVNQNFARMGFSHNVLRGVSEEQTPELSINLFDGENNRRPFFQ